MKNYFKTADERAEAEAAKAGEFPEPIDALPQSELTRRSFLKAAGFAFGAAAATGCQRAPVETAIPYLVQPEEIVPGRPYFIASTCGGCSAGCGVLVKCRDGRPIKLEGNPDHPVNRGGLCAVGQASVLELYDSQRLRHPLMNGAKASWAAVDDAVRARLSGAKTIRFITSTTASPTTDATIERFLSSFPDARRVTYDAIPVSSLIDAHNGVLPRFRFDRADVIVSLGADFLGTWISPVEYAAGYAERRRIDSARPEMSYHAQLEPILTLTGSNADDRRRAHPSEYRRILSALRDRIAGGAQSADPFVEKLAAKLDRARGRSLVVCGSESLADQRVAAEVNSLLGNYGATIDVESPSYQKSGSDRELVACLEEIRSGGVDAVLLAGVNPLAELPDAEALAAALAKVPLVISFASHADETAGAAHFVCPEPHFLEAWRDVTPVAGVLAVAQPAIQRLGETRALLESLSAWMGEGKSSYALIRERSGLDLAAWEKLLNDGFAPIETSLSTTNIVTTDDAADDTAQPGGGAFTLVLYPNVAMQGGAHARNPWLHELPDPVSKVTWDNYASLSPKTAGELGLTDGDVVEVECAGRTLALPAFIQPGQHDEVVAVALGYGRLGTERFSEVGPRWLLGRRTVQKGDRVGRNAAPLIGMTTAGRIFSRDGVSVRKTARRYGLASTQIHNTLSVPPELAAEGEEPRPIVQETTLAAFIANRHAGTPEEEHPTDNLWNAHPYRGHRWAMAIDLSACNGCSGCVIACQAENNIPVVGKDEITRQREMQWLRIDRYYSGGDDDLHTVHQPMSCAHCENAPCESVCPVIATVHSSEGLNQQIYNRCVGTRYCANNCPYKARRFNWFNYPHEDRLQNMVLNPDVTVRSRGVMEKCSMCIQRIEFGKLEAKRQGRPLRDGEIRTACEQSCPAKAIVFGDANDPKSRIAKLRGDPRYYVVLEELNVKPAVGFLRVVRNRDEEEPKHV